MKVVWIKSKWQPACNTETDHFSHRCRLLRCHRQSHLFDFCGAYQIAEHFKTHYYISRVCASEEFESWSVSDFIDAAFTMLVPFMDVCVCAWNTFCIPNSVILITFDTYKLRLSECVRISVMAFHNCKIDSIRSLAHTHRMLFTFCSTSLRHCRRHRWHCCCSHISWCHVQFSRFYDFLILYAFVEFAGTCKS